MLIVAGKGIEKYSDTVRKNGLLSRLDQKEGGV